MSYYDRTSNGRRRPSSSRGGDERTRPQGRQTVRGRTPMRERDDAVSMRRSATGRRSLQSLDERERSVRAASRQQKKKRRSVGADVISFPLSVGKIDGRYSDRTYGRGTTARRVQTQREEAGIPIRPAVYTQGKVGIRDRVNIARRWGIGPSISLWQVVLGVLLLLAIVAVAIAGPLRDCYVAWRDEGVLEVEYEVLSTINEDLVTDVERLNTLEGIEDEARRRGYVYPDEEALVVENLEEETPTEQEELKRRLAEYDESLPWYVHVLDDVFDYSHK